MDKMCKECNKKNCSCEEPIFCGCKNKIEFLCTYYSGNKLEPLNITSGMDGNTVIKIINDYISKITPESPDPATANSFGVVMQSDNVLNITTQDATDLASALTLVNELKAKLNAKLNADRESGQQNEI